ncbi:MAG: IclR family transcriptional regulator [Cephaloticoccus sp.]
MSIAVLDKAFSILEVLARTGRPLSLAELAEESRLPKPTVHRILRSLRELGYVDNAERRGSYALSDRLGSLRAQGRDTALEVRARPVLARLHQDFDETVNLGVLEGIYVRYAHVLETTQPLRWIVKPGARDFFHTVALGRAIVAGLPDDQQQRLLKRLGSALPARGRRAVLVQLARELAATRARGCALEEEETVAGVACVAISLQPMGEPLAGVSVSVPVNRFPTARRDALIAAMRQLAGAMSPALQRAPA